jgi:hypothetical protein
VITKNTVGSSWRKTLGTREWSRVPAEEKAAVREAVLRLLLTDPSDRWGSLQARAAAAQGRSRGGRGGARPQAAPGPGVQQTVADVAPAPHHARPRAHRTSPPPPTTSRVSVQMALLLRNICQFDFPGSWPTPIEALLQAGGCVDPATGGALPPERGLRALKALKQVLQGLQTKRFVADAAAPGTREFGGGAGGEGRRACLQPTPGTAAAGAPQGRLARAAWPRPTLPVPLPPLPTAFTVVTERLNAERRLFKEKLAAGVAPLHGLLAAHMQAFMSCADGWRLHGEFARAAAACVTELALLLPSREALPGGDTAATSLLEGVHTACGALMQGKPLSGGAAAAQRMGWAGRMTLGAGARRVQACQLCALTSHPPRPPPHLPARPRRPRRARPVV